MSTFTAISAAGRPTWTVLTAAANTFVPLSGNSNTIIVTGGYGLGSYGGGAYGTGDAVTISYNTALGTTWTAVTTR